MKWTEVRTAEQAFLESLHAEFPMNAANHIEIQRDEQGRMSDIGWAGITLDSGMPNQLVMEKLRLFAAVEGVQGFDAV